MSQTQSPIPRRQPIQLFFAQANHGKNTLFSWVFGFWLIMFAWVLGQIVLAAPLFTAAEAANPEGVAAMMAGQQAEMSPRDVFLVLVFGGLGAIAAIISTICGFIAVSGKSREYRALKIIASIGMAFTGAGFIMMLASSSGEDTKVITDAIADSPMVLLYLLLTFIPLILGTLLVVTQVHKRAFKTVLTAHRVFRWKRVFVAAGLTVCVSAGLMLVTHLIGTNPISYNFDPTRFFKYLPILLLLIPLQSAAEEIVLRGYMNQGLGQYIKNPWIIFAITSALFMSLHLSNPEVTAGAADGSYYLTILSYFAFGMMACVLTYIDGGLESAIGVHVANNLYLSTVMGYDNSALPTPTVFKQASNGSTDMMVGLISMALLITMIYMTRVKLEPEVHPQTGPEAFD